MPEQTEREMVPGIIYENDANGNIRLATVISSLVEIGYPVQNTMVSYFSHID